ncbi:TPA: HNH endonuclease [Streptococcus agalactiae]|nr:HNH endonuclease [Streptococcus agalactiae]
MKIDTTSKASRHLFYNSTTWKKLRLEAIARDNNECQWCRQNRKVTTDNLEVDHIKELEFYPELATDLANLRTLCKDCHNRRHKRFNYKKKKIDKEINYRSDEWFG